MHIYVNNITLLSKTEHVLYTLKLQTASRFILFKLIKMKTFSQNPLTNAY